MGTNDRRLGNVSHRYDCTATSLDFQEHKPIGATLTIGEMWAFGVILNFDSGWNNEP